MLKRPKTMVELTADWLRQGILEKNWDGAIPGIAVLAQQCGVAENTMRRSVRMLEQEGLIAHVGSGRRRQVTLNPDVALPSRSLRVAVLLRDRLENEDAGFRWVLARVQSELEAQGHRWIQLNKTQADLRYNDARAMQLIAKTQADLWIIVAAQASLLTWLAARPAPFFAIGGEVANMPNVAAAGSDPFPSYAETIRRLCDFGHQRIVFLLPHFTRGDRSTYTIKWLQRELSAYGIEAGNYHFPEWDETPAGLQKQLDAIFKITPPTAIYATSPVWISGILSFLAREGLKVPEDVSIVCGNHASSFLWNIPAIAHCCHDDLRLARRITDWVNNCAHDRKDQKNEKFPVQLMIGGSIGPVARR